jgi:hypothetical protein
MNSTIVILVILVAFTVVALVWWPVGDIRLPWTKLAREIEELKGRVDRLERRSTEPKMWADNMPNIVYWPGRDLSKWEVTHDAVIRKILAHLGLQVIKTEEKAPEVKLEKVKE